MKRRWGGGRRTDDKEKGRGEEVHSPGQGAQ